MSASLRLAANGLLRRPLRTLVRVAVLSAAVALLGAMLLFVGHSLRTMTGSAVRTVPLDLQGPVASLAQAKRVAAGVAAQAGVEQASPTATAPFAGAAHTGPNGTTSAGNGQIYAVPLDITAHIRTFRLLNGALRPGAVVLDQQLSATLGAQTGDTVQITPRAGARPVSLPVSGIALITAADTVFQPLNPLLGPAPAQPPADAMIIPLDTFATTVAPELPSLASGSAAAAVPGAATGTQWQVQAQLSLSGLGSTPAQAVTLAGQITRRIERSLPGQVQFVDNLSDTLNTAAGDALYAETLYVMLAVPGALIALGLAWLAALGTVERDRRDLALLRARGATRRELIAVAVAESAAVGLAAGVLGTALALAAVAATVPGGVGLTVARGLTALVACILVAFGGALAARLAATASVWRARVSEGRRTVQRSRPPLWQRLWLDLACLVLSGLIYWLTASTGFSAVVNPDSNPTLSLSVYMFFAPAMLWVGATLLLVRLRGRLLSVVTARAAGGRARTLGSFLLASAGRRGPAINRGLVVVGLLLAFGVELGIFTATYDQQAMVDAQLTVGGDVTLTAPTGPRAGGRGLLNRVSAVPGVSAATPVDHSYAYVGPDLQDTYGIDPATIGRATTLRDSYFIGGDAATTVGRLRARRDGVLVSKETITDYQLRLGDLLNLRVLDHRSGRFHVVPFHVAGIVQEFPSAPKDSFMVANLSYLRAADGTAAPNTIFARSGDPGATGRRVAAATRAFGTSVKDVVAQSQETVSSITTVDLRGISRIEETFTVALAAAAMALFVALAVTERRHEFATMAALGAPLRTVGAFVWSEAALVLGAAVLLAGVLGIVLALMLVAMLQHVFDPPPASLAVPWAYLLELLGGAVGATAVAVAVVASRLRRLPLGSLLRES